MTKAQKAKAKLAEQRLEAMREAGMLPTGEMEKTQKPVYDNKKKRGKGKGKGKFAQEEPAKPVEEPAPETQAADDDEGDWEKQDVDAGLEKKKDDDGSGGNWDDDSSGDDWDASDHEAGFDDLTARLEKVAVENGDVDLIELEKKKEQERLRQLGLERAERERIEAENLAKLQEEEEQANRQAALIAQKREEGKRKRLEMEKANLEARSPDDLRCPIVVIMGHVDTGMYAFLNASVCC